MRESTGWDMTITLKRSFSIHTAHLTTAGQPQTVLSSLSTALNCSVQTAGQDSFVDGANHILVLLLVTPNAYKCSNLYILLLIPFALAGIALVLLLLICKLTVAAGSINGLIFYANVVTVNRAIFFPPNQTNILTVFIAWLNLDLGIETCFFDGMDEYTKSWLQFVFPIYVWNLVGLIIIVSNYSSRITRLLGSNPVAVLATLFLLSYAKLLHTIIKAVPSYRAEGATAPPEKPASEYNKILFVHSI